MDLAKVKEIERLSPYGISELPDDERTWWVRAAQFDELVAEVERLEGEAEHWKKETGFWLGEGEETRPEVIEYRKLAEINRTERTVEQSEQLGELALLLRHELDADWQRARADKAEETIGRLRALLWNALPALVYGRFCKVARGIRTALGDE